MDTDYLLYIGREIELVESGFLRKVGCNRETKYEIVSKQGI